MLRFAIENLLSRPMRSILSTLGLAVAISGMVGLFSVAGGIDQVVSKTFSQIPGLLIQQQGAPIPLFSSLPAAWQTELQQIPGVAVVDAEVFCRVNQLDGRIIINPPRFAVGLDIPARLNLKRSIYRENLVSGRFLNQTDVLSNNCMVSQEIASSVKKGINQSISINGIEFLIVGIYETGSLMLDVNILMDLNSCRRLGRIDEETVGCFYIEGDESVDNDTLKQRIEDHFRGRSFSEHRDSGTATGQPQGNPLADLIRNLNRAFQSDSPPTNPVTEPASPEEAPNAATTSSLKGTSEDLPIEVRSADDWGDRIDAFSEDLNLFLFLMTAIGVSIATMSIVNTMMMSVTERTTEFGILRANGWSQRDIISLMTLESSLLGFAGGLLGACVGWLATLFINWNWPERLQLHAGFSLLGFSIVFSIILGLAGGLYPAWRASRLSPMESIRRG